MQSLVFGPGADADQVTVNFSNGNPFPAAAFNINGGGGTSELKVVGTAGSDSFVVDGSQVLVNGSVGSQTFSNVRIGYSNVAAISVDGSSGADTLTQVAQPGNGANAFFANTTALDTLNVNVGTMTIPQNNPNSGIVAYNLGTLTSGTGADLAIGIAGNASDRTVLVLNSLQIAASNGAWVGRLDLNNNDLILKAAGSLGFVQALQQLKQGFNPGAGYWNGPGGIVSTSAATNSRFLTTLGYEIGGSAFDGVNTSSADVLVKYTYFGDTDFNGVVNGADYHQLDLGRGLGATGWTDGDFNYDGVVNGTDYALIDNTYNQIAAARAGALAIIASPLALSNIAPPSQYSNLASIGAISNSQSQTATPGIQRPAFGEAAILILAADQEQPDSWRHGRHRPRRPDVHSVSQAWLNIESAGSDQDATDAS